MTSFHHHFVVSLSVAVGLALAPARAWTRTGSGELSASTGVATAGAAFVPAAQADLVLRDRWLTGLHGTRVGAVSLPGLASGRTPELADRAAVTLPGDYLVRSAGGRRVVLHLETAYQMGFALEPTYRWIHAELYAEGTAKSVNGLLAASPSLSAVPLAPGEVTLDLRPDAVAARADGTAYLADGLGGWLARVRLSDGGELFRVQTAGGLTIGLVYDPIADRLYRCGAAGNVETFHGTTGDRLAGWRVGAAAEALPRIRSVALDPVGHALLLVGATRLWLADPERPGVEASAELPAGGPVLAVLPRDGGVMVVTGGPAPTVLPVDLPALRVGEPRPFQVAELVAPRPVLVPAGLTDSPPAEAPDQVVLAPDGRHWASLHHRPGRGAEVRLYGSDAGPQCLITDGAAWAEFTPDGQWLLIGESASRRIRLHALQDAATTTTDIAAAGRKPAS